MGGRHICRVFAQLLEMTVFGFFLIELGCTVVCQINIKDGREWRLDIH